MTALAVGRDGAVFAGPHQTGGYRIGTDGSAEVYLIPQTKHLVARDHDGWFIAVGTAIRQAVSG